MTIQGLRDNLSGLPDDAEVCISGHAEGCTTGYYIDHIYFDNDSNECVIEAEESL